jgi:hypothetical protein
MKQCPKCKTSHNKSGTFCSRSCANSRVFSEESKLKKSIAQKRYWDNLSESEKNKKREVYHNTVKGQRQAYIEYIFSQEWDYLGVQAKRLRVILEQDGKCNKCGRTHWIDEPITLEYEHINGNKTDNARSNVEALCPNCHSLTKTWRGRKNGKKQQRILEYLKLNRNNTES